SDRLDWDAARAAALHAPVPLPTVELPLAAARHAVAAADVLAPGPIPHYDSSAMDGWVVRGAPPWRLVGPGAPLPDGGAAVVVTGGTVPGEATAVVPAERGSVTGGVLTAEAPVPGAHIRRAGEEAAAGSVLVAAGTRLTPAHLAMLAVAGLDAVVARRPPVVAAVLTGDEVVVSGRPDPGRVRDAFDPMLPAAIAGFGALSAPPVRCGDDPEAIAAAVGAAEADLVVTVGGTGHSGADRLREALARLGTTAVFEGVAMRPGSPTLLTRLGDGRPLLALPGNPLAAVVTLASFLPPLLAGLAAAKLPPLPTAGAGAGLPGYPAGTAILPVRFTDAGVTPVPAARPNMLRGLASADSLAVVPPGGAAAGARIRCIPLPW
ncbi:MAG TPA: molybdopterin-binding protein, partial [Amnibacterium sp.]|nr:molybdopterin-binding protein [Amnibacterium sp.]